MKSIKTNFKELGVKAQYLATSLALAMATAKVPVFAGNGSSIGSGAGDDPSAIVKEAINIVVKMFPYVGGFFIVAGLFKLFLAYRNDQPEAQAGAAKDIVVGAVFVVFAVFAWDPISNLLF